MKKILFLISFFVVATAGAQTPTATATATDTPTATPSATATATATATGTPVPTPTPVALVYRQGGQIPLSTPGTQPIDGIDIKQGGNIQFAGSGGTINNANIDNSQFRGAVGIIPAANFAATLALVNNESSFVTDASLDIRLAGLDRILYLEGDFSLNGGFAFDVTLSDDTLVTFPPGTYTVAKASDTGNIIGETHFDGGNPTGTFSVFGNISGVTSPSSGIYSIAFTTTLANASYGVTVTAGDSDQAVLGWAAQVDTTNSDTNQCTVITKRFDPGILGVALPSFIYHDPALVTVVIYKNP